MVGCWASVCARCFQPWSPVILIDGQFVVCLPVKDTITLPWVSRQIVRQKALPLISMLTFRFIWAFVIILLVQIHLQMFKSSSLSKQNFATIKTSASVNVHRLIVGFTAN